MKYDKRFPRGWPILGLTLGMLASPTQAQWESALSFDGVDDQVQVANTPSLVPASQGTFEAWIRPHTSKCNTILSRGHGGENQVTDFIFQVGHNGAGNRNSRLLALMAGGGAWDVSTSTVPLNQWTHVAVTFDGVMKRFYINGALDGLFYGSVAWGDYDNDGDLENSGKADRQARLNANRVLRCQVCEVRQASGELAGQVAIR